MKYFCLIAHQHNTKFLLAGTFNVLGKTHDFLNMLVRRKTLLPFKKGFIIDIKICKVCLTAH